MSERTVGARRALSPELVAQLRPIATLVAALVVLGAVLGLVWAWWSPPVPAGLKLSAGIERQESEGFVSADARFVMLVVAVGVFAAIAAWMVRPTRGPWMALALAVGGLLGAWLTGTIGNAVSGGTDDGPVNMLIPHLELHVQMTGSYYLEAASAVLVYSLLVAFAADDDLGHPDRVRAAAHQRPAPVSVSSSVPPQGGMQNAGGYRDGAGLAQQHDLSPQEPH